MNIYLFLAILNLVIFIRRKRRPLIDELRERRVVRMTWDIDPVTTSEMMKETGVSVFDDGDKMDMDIIYKPAPLMSQTALISQVIFSKIICIDLLLYEN